MHPQTFHQLAALEHAAREADRRRRPTSRRGQRRHGGPRLAPPMPGGAAEVTDVRRPRRGSVRPDGPAGVRP
jgi:hypothetical protein